MARRKAIRTGALIGGALIVLSLLTGGGILWSWVYRPSLTGITADSVYFYIHTGAEYPQVYLDMRQTRWLKYNRGFDFVAQRKGYPDQVKPGRYLLRKGMTNLEIVDLLRSGKQAEVNLVFTTTRTFERLAGVISRQIEADSVSLLQAFRDTANMRRFGFTPETWRGMFIPNTYRFLWNTSAPAFLDRMDREYKDFWNPSREAKLREMGLDRNQLMTLASIVQEETFKPGDMPIVAGVYMNRLKLGIRLQADPTVIFALGDYSIRRVMNAHLLVDSPYNTYRYPGLPPGPIRIPSLEAIESCLDFQKHDFLYFCAKDDFSGYSVFARTYGEHLRNARKYQRALDRKSK